MSYSRAICWIRRDLRLSDHAALFRATELASEVAVVFVFDRNILDELVDKDDKRVQFIHDSLQELDRELVKLGSKLIVLHGDACIEIPRIAKDFRAEIVITARDYEPYAIQRDAVVDTSLAGMNIEFESVKDTVIFEGGEIFSQSGTPMRVYTPYSKVWRSKLAESNAAKALIPNLNHLARIDEIASFCQPWAMEEIGFLPSNLWLDAGESGAVAQLTKFLSHISKYGEERNYPAIDGCSYLSVHLRFGTISIRKCVREAQKVQTPGADKWLAELIWRDFYQDILHHNPQVADTPFQPIYHSLEYPGSIEDFKAWKEGLTGYPVVDAAIRCLNETGYMHNRLRMIVASFLTKDLLCDWRWGERYFARKLLDYDMASNVGGWQWSASVGADAQPYFRIFNPYLQSEKFDSDGVFIKKWVPELSELSSSQIHNPSEAGGLVLAEAGIILGETYPAPIVNHFEMRDQAIKLLETVVKK